jgi:hypothetical protein
MLLLDRAQAYVRSRARIAACAIVPLSSLAGLATTARATAILNPATCTSTPVGSGTTSGGSCASSFISQGINLFGNDGGNPLSPGFYGLQFDWTGTGSGSNTDPIPVRYNFSATPLVTGRVDYSLEFLLNGISELTLAGSLTSETNYQVIGLTQVPFSGDLSSYEVKLTVSQNNGTRADGIRLDVPDPNGIQLTPLNTVPEPASALLILSGAAFLLMFGRRKRRA